jgi:hypothetical protein
MTNWRNQFDRQIAEDPSFRSVAPLARVERDSLCGECRRLMDQYGECIEQAHDLRNQTCDLTLLPDRVKVFEQVLSRLAITRPAETPCKSGSLLTASDICRESAPGRRESCYLCVARRSRENCCFVPLVRFNGFPEFECPL